MSAIYRVKYTLLTIVTSLFSFSTFAQTALTLPANMPGKTFSKSESVTYKFDETPGSFNYIFKKDGTYNKTCKSTLTIQWSDEGSTWSTINSYSNSFDQSVTVPLSKTTRYIKISFDKCWSNASTAILQSSSIITKSLDVREADDSKVSADWVASTISINSATTKQIKVRYDNLADKVAIGLSDATHFSVSTTEIGGAGAKGESLVTITYSPKTVGSHSATLTIQDTGSGGDNQIIKLSGSASPEQVQIRAASDIKDFSFIANWGAAAGATSYKLTVKQAETIILSENVGNSTSKTISGLNFNTTYSYDIVAQAVDAPDAPASSLQSVLTTSPIVAVSPATGATYTSFVANWNLLAGVSGYRVSVADESHQIVSTADHIVGINTAAITGLLPDHTYYYTVAAYNTAGVYTAESTPVAVSTTSMIPQGVQEAVDISYFGFKAAWQAVDGVTGYRVNIYKETERVVSQDFEPTQSYGVVTGLALNTTYTYRVQALLGEIASNESAQSASFITLDAPLSGVTASATGVDGRSISISWSPLPAGVADRYEVEVINKYNNTTILPFTQGATINNLYSLTGLSKGTTYSYQVRAIIKGAPSEASAIQTVRTPISLDLTITNASQEESEWFHLKDQAKIENGAYNLGNIEFEVSEAPRSVDIEFEATDNGWTIVPKLEVYEWDIKTAAWRALYSGTWENGNNHKLSVNLSPTTRYISIKKATYGAAINGNLLLRNITISKASTSVEPPVVLPATDITASGFTANWAPVAEATDYRVTLYENYNAEEIPLANYSLTVGNITSKVINIPINTAFTGSYKVEALVQYAWTNQSAPQPINTLVGLPLQIADQYDNHGIVYRNTTTYDQGVVFAAAEEGAERELAFRFDATPGFLQFTKAAGTVAIYTAKEDGVFTENPIVAESSIDVYSHLMDSDVRHIRLVANNNKLTGIAVTSDFHLLSSNKLTFAPLEVGATSEQYITLNALHMSEPLTISSTNELQFSIPTQIAATANVQIPIHYNPQSAGQHTVRVTISEGSRSIVVDIEGSSQLAVPTVAPVTNISRTEATISWSSVVGADSYILNVKSGDNLVSGYTDKNVGNATTSLISGLTPATTYQVTIQAQQGGFKSPTSATVEFATSSPALACATFLPPLFTQDGLTLSWVSIDGADQYLLSIDGEVVTVTDDKTSYDIQESLTQSKVYTCSIIASLSSDESRNSDVCTQQVARTLVPESGQAPVIDIDTETATTPDIVLDEYASAALIATTDIIKVGNIQFTTQGDITSSLTIAPNKSIEVSGSIELKKQFASAGDWEFISFPFDVSAGHISGLFTAAEALPMGDDNKSGAYYVRKYATSIRAQQGVADQVWEYVKAPTNPSSIIFEKNRGYIVSLDKQFATHLPADQLTLLFSSAKSENALFNDRNGDNIGLDASRKTSGDDRNVDGGWNLIGNPYAHPYLINNLPERATGLLSEFVYYYDKGDYLVWSTESALEGDNQPMRPFSAYFVKSNGAQQVNLSCSNARSVVLTSDYDQLILHLSQSGHQSRTVIRLKEESTSLFDSNLDAPYMQPLSSSTTQFYSHSDLQYAYNSLPFSQDRAVVALGYGVADMQGDATISLSKSSRLSQTVSCLLTDQLTGSQVDLMVEDYTFSPTSKPVSKDRFTLQLSRVSTGDISQPSDIHIYGANGVMMVDNMPMGGRISVIDMSGVVRYDRYSESNHLEITLPMGALYIVRVVDRDHVAVRHVKL